MTKSMEKSRKRKTAWFPEASIIKLESDNTQQSSKNNKKVTILLFYQYLKPLWTEQRMKEAITFLETQIIKYKLGGRIRVSREGINATISGFGETNCKYFTISLETFDERFKETDYKFINDLNHDRMFKDCRILPVKELVYYGIDMGHDNDTCENNSGNDGESGGKHIDPQTFHDKLKDNNTVIIDVRNAYETDIGRFDKQENAIGGSTGAKLILPNMRKSTDFVPWIKSAKTKEQLYGKDILMYCTGGVRCERASVLLKKEVGCNSGSNNDGIGQVYQLKGGIEKYLQTFPDGGFFRGKNFVFDKREAIGPNCVNGVGGVVETAKKESKKNKSDNNNTILSKCCICNSPWDRYIGKKKCDTCAVPVLVCQNCCTELGKLKKNRNNHDKQEQEQQDEHKFNLIRCPLCKEQKCTIRACDLEFTDNGKKTKLLDSTATNSSGSNGVSSTVCKWGGGHSKKKGSKNKSTKSKFSDIPCKFGKDCTRADCWFKH